MSEPSKTSPPSVPMPKKRLFSLAGVLNLSLVTLIVAVMLLAYSTYSKLRLYEKSLNSMMNESLPSVIQSGKLYSQMNLLLSVTEQLSMANSEAMRRIASGALQHQLEGLTSPADQQHQQHISGQITSIQRELEQLELLVQQKIAINLQIHSQQNKLYLLHQQLNQDFGDIHNDANAKAWQLLFLNILFESSELITLDEMSQIRQRKSDLNTQFTALRKTSETLEPAQQGIAQQALEKLSETLLHPTNGLIAQRHFQLKILGRVQGRSNFVRNLIADYARLNEFESHQLNQSVLSQAEKTSKLVGEQVKQAGFLFVIILLAYIGFAIFIQRVVVNRLKSLKEQVLLRSAGNSQQIKINGSDEIAELALSFERFASTIEQQKTSLEEMSLRDALTGVANRRAFDDFYSQALNVASRQRWPLSILLIDVDYFKQYNDNYGHSQGDVCLKQVAKLIKSQLPRKTDVLARYGGEEFAVLLPDTSEEGAVTVAKAILSAFKDAQITHDFSGVADHVTVSIGISTGISKGGRLTLPSVEESDKALYEAKRKGRNRWISYSQAEND